MKGIIQTAIRTEKECSALAQTEEITRKFYFTQSFFNYIYKNARLRKTILDTNSDAYVLFLETANPVVCKNSKTLQLRLKKAMTLNEVFIIHKGKEVRFTTEISYSISFGGFSLKCRKEVRKYY